MDAPGVRYTKSGDVSIAYAVVGDGPFDLVFVNGWVVSALEYAWQGPAGDFFPELASFSRLILFSRRLAAVRRLRHWRPYVDLRPARLRVWRNGRGETVIASR